MKNQGMTAFCAVLSLTLVCIGMYEYWANSDAASGAYFVAFAVFVQTIRI